MQKKILISIFSPSLIIGQEQNKDSTYLFSAASKAFSHTSSRRPAKRTHSFLFLDLDGILSK